jgi:hypothetical protein
VGLADYVGFARCLAGPCGDPPCDPPAYGDPCCTIGNFDDDGDIDLEDFGQFQQALTGPVP